MNLSITDRTSPILRHHEEGRRGVDWRLGEQISALLARRGEKLLAGTEGETWLASLYARESCMGIVQKRDLFRRDSTAHAIRHGD